MKPMTASRSARALATALVTELKAQGRKGICPRLWNRSAPETTEWWVVPTTVWPAYEHGKIMISASRAGDDRYFAGLHVEKGFDPRVAAAYPSSKGRKWIMREHWMWFRFLEGLGNGEIARAVRRFEESVGDPALLRIEAGFVSDPSDFDPYADRPLWDVVVFDCTRDGLRIRSKDLPSNLLEGAGESSRWEELARSLAAIPNSDWVWVDLLLGAEVLRVPPERSADSWDAATLWTHALSPWNPWLE